MTSLYLQLLQRLDAAVSDAVSCAWKRDHLKALLFPPPAQKRFVPNRVINGPFCGQNLSYLIFCSQALFHGVVSLIETPI